LGLDPGQVRFKTMFGGRSPIAEVLDDMWGQTIYGA